MSTESPWDDARIHAYVDGALDAETAARIETDSRGDAALAERIAQQRELRRRLRAEFDPVLDEPIPQRLRDVLARPESRAAVTPIGIARRTGVQNARPAWSLREWGALAATLVLGVLLGPLLFRDPTELPIDSEGGRLVAADYLDAALSMQVAGTTSDDTLVRIDLSFRTAGGDYCRTFALQAGPAGLACRRDGRWSVEILDGAVSTSDTGDFRQASSALSPTMLSAMTALGAGEPLTLDEERQRIGAGWDAPGP